MMTAAFKFIIQLFSSLVYEFVRNISFSKDYIKRLLKDNKDLPRARGNQVLDHIK